MIGARAAVALYVALALHLLALLLMLLAPSPQAPAGAGQGLGLGLRLAGSEAVLPPAPQASPASDAVKPGRAASVPEPMQRAKPATLGTRTASEQASTERLAPAHAASPGFTSLSSSTEHAGGGGVDSYFTRLRQHLHRYRRDLALGAEAGRAEVAVVVEADGRVSDLRLSRGSLSKVLDEEALALVLRAQPLPLPPRGEVLRLVVPIYVDP